MRENEDQKETRPVRWRTIAILIVLLHVAYYVYIQILESMYDISVQAFNIDIQLQGSGQYEAGQATYINAAHQPLFQLAVILYYFLPTVIGGGLLYAIWYVLSHTDQEARETVRFANGEERQVRNISKRNKHPLLSWHFWGGLLLLVIAGSTCSGLIYLHGGADQDIALSVADDLRNYGVVLRFVYILYFDAVVLLVFLLIAWIHARNRGSGTFGTARFANLEEVESFTEAVPPQQDQPARTPRMERKRMMRYDHRATLQKMRERASSLVALGVMLILLVITEVRIIVFSAQDQPPHPDPFTHWFFQIESALAWGIPVCMVIVLVVIWYTVSHQRQPDTFGTAHFASQEEAKPLFPTARVPQQPIAPPPSRLILGDYRGREVALSEEHQEAHALFIAPTKKRKTSGIIIPGLLNERGSRSLFINDVKHELIDLCIGAVSEYHDCYIISPTQPAESDSYNPLVHVHTMNDARDVAECILRNTGSSHEPFWDNAARLLLTATILHLRATEPQAPFLRLADILCTKDLKEITDLVTSSPSQLARRLATSFVKNVSNDARLQANIMTDIATRLFDMMDPQIESMTQYNDLDFQRLADTASAVFLYIPPSQASG